MIIVTWLLVASITQIQPISSSPGTSGTTSGGGSSGSGSGTGFGSGSGSGSGLSGGGGSLGFNLPHFNFTLPKFNFNFPNINQYLPKLNFAFPNLGSLFGSGGAGLFGSGGGSGSGGTGGSGSSSGAGSGGSSGSGGTSQSTTAHPVLPPINQFLLIIIISVVAVSAVVLTLSKMSFSRRKNSDKDEEGNQELLPSVAAPNESENYKDSQVRIGAGESIAAMEGWSNGDDLIKPEINEDLPLIWSTGVTVGIDYNSDATLDASCDLHTESRGKAVAIPGKSCNVIRASMGKHLETKYIRGVLYENDVVDLMHLNILNEAGFRQDDLTVREIIERMSSNWHFKDRSELPLLVEIFERSFYGKMQVDRYNYEQFLYGLSHSMVKPRVIICKGNEDSN